jgi:hypothetical protein
MDVSATHLEQLRMSAAVERSLESAAQLSTLDSAMVALLRHAAEHIDTVTDKGGVVDSPTLNSFVRICTELGLTPLARGEVKPSAESGSVRGARLVALQDGRRRA